MISKANEAGILERLKQLEIEKIKLGLQLAELTRKQGEVLNEYIELSGLPKDDETICIDIGPKLFTGTYLVKGHGFSISSKPEKKAGKYTGAFMLMSKLQAFGYKLKTRKQMGVAQRVVAEKEFKIMIQKDEVFLPDQDPNKILAYQRQES